MQPMKMSEDEDGVVDGRAIWTVRSKRDGDLSALPVAAREESSVVLGSQF